MDTNIEPNNDNQAEERRNTWRLRIEQHSVSGQTIKAYCEANGFKPWQFHYWRSTLREKTEPSIGFVEMCQQGKAGIQIEVGKARIEVVSGFDHALLREIVTALANT